MAEAAAAIAGADALLVTAGAGMGVDSGLPDFRGDAGFWKRVPGLRAPRAVVRRSRGPALVRGGPAPRLGLLRPPAEPLSRDAPARRLRRSCAPGARRGRGARSCSPRTSTVSSSAPASIPSASSSATARSRPGSARAAAARASSPRRRPRSPSTPSASAPPIRCHAVPAAARSPAPTCSCSATAGGTRRAPAAQHRRLERWLAELAATRARLAIVECGAGTAVPTVRLVGEALARRLRRNPHPHQRPRAGGARGRDLDRRRSARGPRPDRRGARRAGLLGV